MSRVRTSLGIGQDARVKVPLSMPNGLPLAAGSTFGHHAKTAACAPFALFQFGPPLVAGTWFDTQKNARDTMSSYDLIIPGYSEAQVGVLRQPIIFVHHRSL